jgi:hypothetical protein
LLILAKGLPLDAYIECRWAELTARQHDNPDWAAKISPWLSLFQQERE